MMPTSLQREHMLTVIAAAFSRAVGDKVDMSKLRAANPNHAALIIERMLEEAAFRIIKKKTVRMRSLQPSAAGADGGVQA